MSDVKSKNLYELLGNTSDQDSDREPELPTKTVDKPTGRSGKRDAPKAAPAEPLGDVANSQRGGRGGRRGGFTGNEGAFRDQNSGRNFNRGQPTEGEDGVQTGRDSGPGTRRGGRGPRGPRRGGDRHSRTGQTEHTKQTGQFWGQNTGDGEFADEKAGEAIAKKEESTGWDTGKNEAWDANAAPVPVPEGTWDAGGDNPDFKDSTAPPAGDGFGEATAADPEAEPEDNSKSYADYLAEQAANKLEALGLKEARKPNEGAKDDKKWKNAKALAKEDDNEPYFEGEAKARRERDRARNVKEKVDIDFSFKEPDREARGGGRGRGRGRGDRGDRGDFRGRGRGDREGGFRGDRESGFRGDREGGFRGGRGDGYRGRGDRGDFRGRGRGRGGRGESSGNGTPIAVDDDSAFPSLGGSK